MNWNKINAIIENNNVKNPQAGFENTIYEKKI